MRNGGARRLAASTSGLGVRRNPLGWVGIGGVPDSESRGCVLATIEPDGRTDHRSHQATRGQNARRAAGADAPGQANTGHRHVETAELSVLLEGIGRIRIDGELLTVGPLDAILVEPDSLRQPFNDTGDDQLWLIVGAPQEPANTLRDDTRDDCSPVPGRAQVAPA